MNDLHTNSQNTNNAMKTSAFLLMTWFVGNLCVYFFMPFLPLVGKALSVSALSLQSLLSLFYMAKAGGMLIWGPASERFGLKAIMICGIVIICIGSVGAVFSTHISELFIFRLMQGLGVSATVLMGRTMLNDLFSGKRAVTAFGIVMVLANIIISVLPAAAGYLTAFHSYKIPFAVVAIYTFILAILAIFFLKESKQSHPDFSFSIKKVPSYYLHVLKERKFIGYMLCVIFVIAAEAAFDTASPLVMMQHLHVSAKNYGLLVGMASFISGFGLLGAGLLVKRYSIENTLGVGAVLSLIASVLIFAQLFIFSFSVAGFMISFSILSIGMGFVLTIYNVGVVQSHQKIIGIASSASMFLYFLSSSLGSFIISLFSTSTTTPLTIAIGSLSALVFLSWILFIKILPSRLAVK